MESFLQRWIKEGKNREATMGSYQLHLSRPIQKNRGIIPWSLNLKSRVPIFKRRYLSWVVRVDLPGIHLNEPEFNIFGYSFPVFPQRYTRWFILQPINLGPLPSGSLSKMAHWSRWFDDWPPKTCPLFFAKAQIIQVTPRCTGERTPSSARNSVTTCGFDVGSSRGTVQKNGLISVTLW